METAKEIKEYLDKYIEGQESAKRAAAVLCYNNTRGVKENIVFCGPSGCGKTEIFRTLRNLYPGKIYIYDASGTTEQGWSGKKKVYTVFLNMHDAGFSVDAIEHSIIVFDEFDKVCNPKYTSKGDNAADSIQGEFLTMIEGADIPVDGLGVINTENISFVFCGAFETIYEKRRKIKEKRIIGFNSENQKEKLEDITMEDLIEYGMRAEIAGRIAMISTLDPLNENQVRNMLMSEYRSPITKLAIKNRYKVTVKKELIDDLVAISQDNKRGVRSMLGEIQKLIDQEIYEAGSSGKLKIEELDGDEEPMSYEDRWVKRFKEEVLER